MSNGVVRDALKEQEGMGEESLLTIWVFSSCSLTRTVTTTHVVEIGGVHCLRLVIYVLAAVM